MMIRLTFLLVLLSVASPAFAEEAKAPAPEAAAAAPAKKKPAPASAEERLDAKAEEMMKKMDENQIRQFAAIRTAHGTLRAVEDVRDSLDRAVKSCSKANPELAKDMGTGFQAWKNDVLPVVRQGQNRLEKMILTQNFDRPSTVRAYLKNFDDLIKSRKAQYTEVPVSTKDACSALNDNMAKSQRVMGKLITETLGLDKDLKTTE